MEIYFVDRMIRKSNAVRILNECEDYQFEKRHSEESVDNGEIHYCTRKVMLWLYVLMTPWCCGYHYCTISFNKA